MTIVVESNEMAFVGELGYKTSVDGVNYYQNFQDSAVLKAWSLVDPTDLWGVIIFGAGDRYMFHAKQ